MRTLVLFAIFAFPSWAGRLVSTSPQATEVLFQLGLGSEVVGTVDGSHFPKEASRIRTIGSLFAPSIEKLVALTPTLVVLDSLNLAPHFQGALRSLGLPFFVLRTHSPETLVEDSSRLLGTLSREEPPLLKRWKKCLAPSKPSSKSGSKSIAFVWWEPAIVLGRDSFLSLLLEKSGFQNLVSAVPLSVYPSVSEEWLLQNTPEVVFFLEHMAGNRDQIAEKVRNWWPKAQVTLVALPSERFARASFTSLESVHQRYPLRGCRAN
jgi:ABC-type Fe3+-hydroxamate transport system substrate-binding protein